MSELYIKCDEKNKFIVKKNEYGIGTPSYMTKNNWFPLNKYDYYASDQSKNNQYARYIGENPDKNPTLYYVIDVGVIFPEDIKNTESSKFFVNRANSAFYHNATILNITNDKKEIVFEYPDKEFEIIKPLSSNNITKVWTLPRKTFDQLATNEKFTLTLNSEHIINQLVPANLDKLQNLEKKPKATNKITNLEVTPQHIQNTVINYYLNEFKDSISKRDYGYIRNYSLDSFLSVNTMTRNVLTTYENGESTLDNLRSFYNIFKAKDYCDDTDALCKGTKINEIILANAKKRPFSHDIVTYRGMKSYDDAKNPDQNKNMSKYFAVGNTVLFKNLFSTSFNADKAVEFHIDKPKLLKDATPYYDNCCLFKFKIPGNYPYIYFEGYVPCEFEVLLPFWYNNQPAKFKIVSEEKVRINFQPITYNMHNEKCDQNVVKVIEITVKTCVPVM